jgi:hypothetical protein
MMSQYKKYLSLILVSCLCLSLNACELFQNPEDNHQALCKEIKHRLIYTGATADQREKWQQRSDQTKLNEMYQTEDCK